MENQHKKIKGYRDLSSVEVNLMNEIKEHAERTASLLEKVSESRLAEAEGGYDLTEEQYSESMRCLALAKTSLQTGQMWFVRSVALPESF